MTETLRGVRILDLTWMLAGPYGTLLLADMGAEVIKIEPPSGDPIRRMGPPFEPDGSSAYFRSVNRNKKSVVLDLTSRLGHARFIDLVRTSDVVVDNYRPGVTERLHLSHDELKSVKPDIITCSLTAFGSSGPYRDFPAFDLIIQAIGGGMSITGQPGEPPTRAGIPIGDLAGGLFSALAICAALVRRDRTGKAQQIDLSLLDAQVSLLTYIAQYHLTDGRVPGPIGSAHQSSVPYQAFQTQDGYVVVCVLVDRFWPALCNVLGLPGLAQQYVTNTERVAARDFIIPLLERRFRERTTSDWLSELRSAGVPVAPVNTVDKVVTDPQVLHRKMVVTVSEHTILGNPIKTGEADTFRSPPKLGEHNDEFASVWSK